MLLTALFVTLAVVLLTFGYIKLRFVVHGGGLSHLILAGLSIGLAVFPVVQIVRYFSGCACGG